MGKEGKMKGSVGERLKSLRGSRSQDDVAKAIGISQTALSNYENDIRTPRDGIKVLIANYYKRSVQSIFF